MRLAGGDFGTRRESGEVGWQSIVGRHRVRTVKTVLGLTVGLIRCAATRLVDDSSVSSAYQVAVRKYVVVFSYAETTGAALLSRSTRIESQEKFELNCVGVIICDGRVGVALMGKRARGWNSVVNIVHGGAAATYSDTVSGGMSQL